VGSRGGERLGRVCICEAMTLQLVVQGAGGLEAALIAQRSALQRRLNRSGWQPPKDTGLWEVATRIKGEIQSNMTAAQREYWEAEGGYFDQVSAVFDRV